MVDILEAGFLVQKARDDYSLNRNENCERKRRELEQKSPIRYLVSGLLILSLLVLIQ